jgi:hypothetical protein
MLHNPFFCSTLSLNLRTSWTFPPKRRTVSSPHSSTAQKTGPAYPEGYFCVQVPFPVSLDIYNAESQQTSVVLLTDLENRLPAVTAVGRGSASARCRVNTVAGTTNNLAGAYIDSVSETSASLTSRNAASGYNEKNEIREIHEPLLPLHVGCYHSSVTSHVTFRHNPSTGNTAS